MSISTMRQRPAKALAKPGSLAISRPPLSAWEPHQIVGGGSEGKSPSDAITATPDFSCPAIVLIQPNASSMRLRMRWLTA